VERIDSKSCDELIEILSYQLKSEELGLSTLTEKNIKTIMSMIEELKKIESTSVIGVYKQIVFHTEYTVYINEATQRLIGSIEV